MNDLPPTRRSCPPSRRSASGRVWHAATILLAVLVVAACASLPPSPVPGTTNPSVLASATTGATPASETPSAGREGLAGLLVAVGGDLRVTTDDGTLAGMAAPEIPTVSVSSGSGTVVAVGRDRLVRRSVDPTPDPRTWQVVTLPTENTGTPPLVAVSPGGDRLAQTVGALQGRSFELVVLELATGAARSISVERGLDGPPVWLGPRTIAVHAIRPDQSSGFASADLDTGQVTDLPSFGSFLTASASGGNVALDRATNGQVLVGDPADMTPNRVARLTTIWSPSGPGVDGLALDGTGERLAVVRQTPVGSAIVLYGLAGGAWLAGPTLSLATDDVPSIAWIR